MPIKIQSDLPAKEILEKENIFVMVRSAPFTRISARCDPDPESDAPERRDGTADFALSVEFSAAD